MKSSTKAKLAVYINFVCFLVETAVGICVAILAGYELVLIFAGYFYETDVSIASADYNPSDITSYVHQADYQSSNEKKVALYDQGLQMPIGWYEVPEGWQMMQDVRVEPQGGYFTNYIVYFVGPQGELICDFGLNDLKSSFGDENFHEAWKHTLRKDLQGMFSNITIGGATPWIGKAADKIQKNLPSDSHCQLLEAAITAYRDNKAVQGVARIIDYKSRYNAEHQFDTSISIGLSGQLDSVLQVQENILTSYTPNPEHENFLQWIREYHRARNCQYIQAFTPFCDSINSTYQDYSGLLDSISRLSPPSTSLEITY